MAASDAGYKPTSLPGAAALFRRFPARPGRPPGDSVTTRRSRGQVLALLSNPPFAFDAAGDQARQHHRARAVLAWLSEFPGDTRQDRFLTSTAQAGGNTYWKGAAPAW